MAAIWTLPLLGSIAGVAILAVSLVNARGVQQEQAGAVIALAAAVLPYVFAASIERVARRDGK